MGAGYGKRRVRTPGEDTFNQPANKASDHRLYTVADTGYSAKLARGQLGGPTRDLARLSKHKRFRILGDCIEFPCCRCFALGARVLGGSTPRGDHRLRVSGTSRHLVQLLSGQRTPEGAS